MSPESFDLLGGICHKCAIRVSCVSKPQVMGKRSSSLELEMVLELEIISDPLWVLGGYGEVINENSNVFMAFALLGSSRHLGLPWKGFSSGHQKGGHANMILPFFPHTVLCP